MAIIGRNHQDWVVSNTAHQCARFATEPKVEHGKVVRWIGRYLKETHNKGMTLRPDRTCGLEIYVDGDFAGNWNKEEAFNDQDTACSRHGYLLCIQVAP